MVKLLTELHGGSVAVESEVGKGSCFTVWLPMRGVGEAVHTAERLRASPGVESSPSAHVALVVEDDFKSADLIRLQLEAEGFSVIHAASAEAALVLAVQQPLSLMTLDIMLPNMGGWEFLARVKQVPALQRIPVVIVSIGAEENQGFALGASAVMQKPISRRELHATLGELGLLPVPQGETLKVLVVDDDRKAVDLIAVRISSVSSTVLRAYGGREAIEIASRELPDLIVLDLMMPEVNGFEVVAALSENRATASIPILILTAMEITAADRERLSGSVSVIMQKTGFDSARFMAEVRRAMAGRAVGTLT
jgi:CheY-like chemotaxis protein